MQALRLFAFGVGENVMNRHWQKLIRPAFKGGGNKSIATLSGDADRPCLLIGAKLKAAGFDTSLKYEILFDPNNIAIGLRPVKQGRKIMAKHNSSGTSIAHEMDAKLLVKQFDLHARYTAISVLREGDIWVLPLRKT